MTEPKDGQMKRRGVVLSVDPKTYGTAGKSMLTIRIEAEGFEGKVVPYEIKSFKLPFGKENVGKLVEVLVWVNGSYGKPPHEGRIFTDLTLADWALVETTESGTVEHAVEPVTDDAALPF